MRVMRLAFDAKRKARKARTAREAKMSPRERKLAAQASAKRWTAARKAEHAYARALRQIASRVGEVIATYVKRGWVYDKLDELTHVLGRYADVIEPWAKAVAARMLADVNHRSEQAWFAHAEAMGLEIRREIRSTPVGRLYWRLMDDQVKLIRSIPKDAAKRVHQFVSEGISSGKRAAYVADAIQQSGHVARGRAELIAYTETSRASTLFTEARAQHLGSREFIWRTSRDGNVRKTHKAQDGKTFPWGAPPKTDAGLAPYLPGCGPRCRCHAEPVLPDDLL